MKDAKISPNTINFKTKSKGQLGRKLCAVVENKASKRKTLIQASRSAGACLHATHLSVCYLCTRTKAKISLSAGDAVSPVMFSMCFFWSSLLNGTQSSGQTRRCAHRGGTQKDGELLVDKAE